MRPPRILVARIFHEAHSFNPTLTTADDFTVERGEFVITAQRSGAAILGGLIRALERAGGTIVPSVSAMARPGGPVDHGFYEELKRQILLAARQGDVDGVALELHGAMLTDQIDDPEGDLVCALRTALGPRCVIGVGLDLHAHVTPKMLANASFCIACKTNPHADFPETGERVAALMLGALERRLVPVTAYAAVPMLLPGAMETGEGPLARLHAMAERLAQADENILDVSICNASTFIDVAGSGQSIMVTANNDPEAAGRAARKLAAALWDWRHEFTSDLPTIDEALNTVLANPAQRPFVLGDQGDRVIAGTPGDGNAILRRLLERRLSLRAVVPITDPAAAKAAARAGVGATITLKTGDSDAADVSAWP